MLSQMMSLLPSALLSPRSLYKYLQDFFSPYFYIDIDIPGFNGRGINEVVSAMPARTSEGDRREPDDGAKTPESMDLMESPENKESSPGNLWSAGFEGRMGGMGGGR